MDTQQVMVWWLVITTGTAIFAWFRAGQGRDALYLVYNAVILAATLAGSSANQPVLIYICAAGWFLVVMTPSLLVPRYNDLVTSQQFGRASWLARLIFCLHPTRTWRLQPRIAHALELAQAGDAARAEEILVPLQDTKSLQGLAITMQLYRIRNQWQEAVEWQVQHAETVGKYPALLPHLLRARGEAGDLPGLVAMYAANRPAVARLPIARYRQQCRLMLLAYCGRFDAVAKLVQDQFDKMSARHREFWLATAELAAGQHDQARPRLEALLSETDAMMRALVRNRLDRLSFPPVALDAAARELLDSVAHEAAVEQNVAPRATLFSRRARVTQIVIALNVAMFVVEMLAGGATDSNVLFHLGAMAPSAVFHGEWWRLFISTFLHFGWLHIGMNMLGLSFLGPFTESSLGRWRYALLYVTTGIGSMLAVAAFSEFFGKPAETFAVGASGCIMGLVGATGALVLCHLGGEGGPFARRRLFSVILIILLQTFFDWMIPEVSMTAHLSGALIGFVVALVIHPRVRPPPIPAAAQR